MDKEKLTIYLQGRLDSIDQKGFDFDIWKQATLSVLKNALGDSHFLVRQFRQLEYSYKTSIEALYPTQEQDLEATRKRAKAVINEVIGIIDTVDLPRKGELAGSEEKIEQEIITALKDELNGKQIKELIEVLNDPNKDLGKISFKVENYDKPALVNILSRIIAVVKPDLNS